MGGPAILLSLLALVVGFWCVLYATGLLTPVLGGSALAVALWMVASRVRG